MEEEVSAADNTKKFSSKTIKKVRIVRILRYVVFALALISWLTTWRGFYRACLPDSPFLALTLSFAVQCGLLALNFLFPILSKKKARWLPIRISALAMWVVLYLISAFFSVVFYVNYAYASTKEAEAEAILSSQYIKEAEQLNQTIQSQIIHLQDAATAEISALQTNAPELFTKLVSQDNSENLTWFDFCNKEQDFYKSQMNDERAKTWDLTTAAWNRSRVSRNMEHRDKGEETEICTEGWDTEEAIRQRLNAYVESLGCGLMVDTLDKLKTIQDVSLTNEEILNDLIDTVLKNAILEVERKMDEKVDNEESSAIQASAVSPTEKLANSGNSVASENIKDFKNQQDKINVKLTELNQRDKESEASYRNELNIQSEYLSDIITLGKQRYSRMVSALEKYQLILGNIRYTSRYYIGRLATQIYNLDMYVPAEMSQDDLEALQETYPDIDPSMLGVDISSKSEVEGSELVVSQKISEAVYQNTRGKSASEIFSELEVSMSTATGNTQQIYDSLKKLGHIIKKLDFYIRASTILAENRSSPAIYKVYYDAVEKKDKNDDENDEHNVQNKNGENLGLTYNFKQTWSTALNDLLLADALVSMGMAIEDVTENEVPFVQQETIPPLAKESMETQHSLRPRPQTTSAKPISTVEIQDEIDDIYDMPQKSGSDKNPYGETLAERVAQLKYAYCADLNEIEQMIFYIFKKEYNTHRGLGWFVALIGILCDLIGLVLGFIIANEKVVAELPERTGTND